MGWEEVVRAPRDARHSRAPRPEGQVWTEVWRHQEIKGNVAPSHTFAFPGPSHAQYLARS